MKINVVIPMAGLGSRFQTEGYEDPKPFIPVKELPMIEQVLKNLQLSAQFQATYILIARKEHLVGREQLISKLEREYNAKFLWIDKMTQGTACTMARAAWLANNDTPMMIANSDQIVDIKIEDFVSDAINRDLDGSILTFKEQEGSSKWSFAKVGNDNNLVESVAEKVRISDDATVGIYYFKKGQFFFNSAMQMVMIEEEKMNGEFYVCPTYNYLIKGGGKVGIFNIEHKKMHGIGTPEDLKKYLAL